MKNFRKIFAALLLCGAVILTGCSDAGKDKKASETEKEAVVQNDAQETVENTQELPEEDTVTEENAETTEETEPAEEESEEVEEQLPLFVNKLTGLETTELLADVRPVAIMINNLKQALPQQGISQADIMYEVLAEGGITRLLCLFTDYASLPETGSVRSSRDYYIDLADAHDAIYVHCGTSPQATAVLKERNTNNMDGIYFSTPFYRNAERRKNMGQEHSMMTTGEFLVKGIEQKGYRTQSDADQPFSFNVTDTPLESGLKADRMELTFSYYQTVELEYDAESGVYLKKQYGKPHMDSNNDTQLTFENALVLYCEQGAIKGDDAGRLYVNFFGDGEGQYMSNGEYKNIKWHKDSRTSTYTIYEEDGVTEVLLNPGKTYVAIAPAYISAVFE